VAGAVVGGVWSGGASGSASCTTNGAGDCTVSLSKIKSSSVTFTVTSVTSAGSSYAPGANHDADGDSTGTVITLVR
jgi:hypothetical protein